MPVRPCGGNARIKSSRAGIVSHLPSVIVSPCIILKGTFLFSHEQSVSPEGTHASMVVSASSENTTQELRAKLIWDQAGNRFDGLEIEASEFPIVYQATPAISTILVEQHYRAKRETPLQTRAKHSIIRRIWAGKFSANQANLNLTAY